MGIANLHCCTCSTPFSDDDIKRLCEPIYNVKYQNLKHPHIWCKVANCGKKIKLSNRLSSDLKVVCECGKSYCSNCGNEWHGKNIACYPKEFLRPSIAPGALHGCGPVLHPDQGGFLYCNVCKNRVDPATGNIVGRSDEGFRIGLRCVCGPLVIAYELVRLIYQVLVLIMVIIPIVMVRAIFPLQRRCGFGKTILNIISVVLFPVGVLGYLLLLVVPVLRRQYGRETNKEVQRLFNLAHALLPGAW
jgi:hypothetical protein